MLTIRFGIGPDENEGRWHRIIICNHNKILAETGYSDEGECYMGSIRKDSHIVAPEHCLVYRASYKDFNNREVVVC